MTVQQKGLVLDRLAGSPDDLRVVRAPNGGQFRRDMTRRPETQGSKHWREMVLGNAGQKEERRQSDQS